MGSAGTVILFVSSLVGCAIWSWIYFSIAAHYFLVTIIDSSAGRDEIRYPSEHIMDLWWKPLFCLWVLVFWIMMGSVVLVPCAALNSVFLTVLLFLIVWLLYPIGLLSALATHHWFQVVHPPIVWRLLREYRAFAYVHLITFLSFAVCAGFLAGMFGHSFLWALPATFVLPTALLMYARHWGRFAWFALNEPPKKKKRRRSKRVPTPIAGELPVAGAVPVEEMREEEVPEEELSDEESPEEEAAQKDAQPQQEAVPTGELPQEVSVPPAEMPRELSMPTGDLSQEVSVPKDEQPQREAVPTGEPPKEQGVLEEAPVPRAEIPRMDIDEPDPAVAGICEGLPPAYPHAIQAGSPSGSESIEPGPPPQPIMEEKEDEWATDGKYAVIEETPQPPATTNVPYYARETTSDADKPISIARFYDDQAKMEKELQEQKEAKRTLLPPGRKNAPTFESLVSEAWVFMIYPGTIQVWINLVALTIVELFFLFLVVRFWPTFE